MSWVSRILRRVPPHNPAAISSVSQRLDSLRQLDRGLKVFGADTHRYVTHRVSERELSRMEQWCGVSLPGAFRSHLASIGYGVGPYYGIWSPAAIRKELDALCSDYQSEVGPSPSPSRPFPYSISDAQKIDERKASGEKEPWITSTWPIDGCIPICHQGCTFWTVLVVNGECAGRVWDVANYVGYEGLWLPSRRPTGKTLFRKDLKLLPALPSPPTFDEWFMDWIERATTDLST